MVFHKKDNIKSIFKLDNKTIMYWMLFYLMIFTYNIVRTLFVTNTDGLFAISEGVVYIQMIREIMIITLVSPSIFLYKNSKKDTNNGYISILLFGLIISLILIVVNLLTMPFIVNSMLSINNGSNIWEIYTFIITSMIGSIGILFLYIYVSIFTFKKDYNSILYLMVIQMTIFISLDIIFLSNLVFKKQNIIGVSFSNITAPLLSALIGLGLVCKKRKLKFKSYKFNNIFKSRENKNYLLQSVPIAIEGVIRQLVYVFITLGIMNSLGSDDWSSWNLSMNIFFGMFLNLSFAIKIASYNEYANNEKSTEVLKTSLIYTTVLIMAMLAIAYPLFEIFLPWNANNSDFVPKAIQTSWYLLVPIFLLMYSQMFIPYFNSNGNSKYYLYNQLIQLPLNIVILILLQTKVIVGNYFISCFMFALGIFLTCVNYFGFFLFENIKQKRKKL